MNYTFSVSINVIRIKPEIITKVVLYKSYLSYYVGYLKVKQQNFGTLLFCL